MTTGMSAPPIAIVNVTPIMADKPAVVPNMDIPTLKLGSIRKYAIAAILPASRPLFRACRPGNISGAEFSRPCNFPYATRDPVNVTPPI